LQFTVFGQLPQSGVFIGQQAVIDNVFAKIAAHWPEFSVTPINFDVVGDTVYVHNKMTAAGLDSETMHMFRLRDGKIAAFTAFEDTDSMRQAMVTP
jgi:ketosteroid isomerase-like protein